MLNIGINKEFIKFNSIEEKIKELKEWELLSKKVTEIKPLFYN